MKIKNLILALMVALMVMPNISFAQEENKGEFKISADFRVRTEYRDGFKKLLTENQNGALVTGQRFRMNFDYKNDKIATRFSLQDVRSWGESPIIDMGKTDVQKPLFVKEAWLKYNFNANWGLKIGRQELAYGDNRLISTRDWNLYGASHDAAILQFKNEKTAFDFAFANNSNNEWSVLLDQVYAVSNYKYMGLLYVSHKFSDSFSLNVMNLAEGLQGTEASTVYVRNTVGPNVVAKFGKITLDASFYQQLGKSGSDAVDISSNMLTANLFFAPKKGTKVKLGYDMYSGTAYDITEPVQNTFNPVQWAGHKFLGRMDYFVGGIPTRGITDINAFVTTTLGKTSIFAEYHMFSLINDLSATNTDKALGSEIDLWMKKGFGKGMAVQAGYSVMLPTETLETMKGIAADQDAKFAHWAWVMVVFKPTFFVSK